MKKSLFISFSLLLMLISCIKEKPTGEELKVGDVLPDFKVEMTDGSLISDDDLKKGVSLVMFFHTTCPDCRQALPSVQRIYDEYISEGVLFSLISREEGQDDIDTYFSENGLKMPYSAQKDRKVYEMFAKTRIPRIYICEKGGIIRYIYTDDPVPSYDELKSSIESLIR